MIRKVILFVYRLVKMTNKLNYINCNFFLNKDFLKPKKCLFNNIVFSYYCRFVYLIISVSFSMSTKNNIRFLVNVRFQYFRRVPVPNSVLSVRFLSLLYNKHGMCTKGNVSNGRFNSVWHSKRIIGMLAVVQYSGINNGRKKEISNAQRKTVLVPIWNK